MNPEELKKLHDEQMTLVKEIRQLSESKKAESVEAQAKIEKMETRLNEIEKKNQELATEMTKKDNEARELKEKYDLLEKQAFRLANGGKGEKTAHMKAFENFITKGITQLSAEEMKYLRTDDAAQGGYLAPPEYIMEIIKDVTEISNMRSVCRVRQTTKGMIEIPKRTSGMTGGWVGEGGTNPESESKYGMILISCKELSANAIISHKMLNDSAFNMESEINADIIDTFAQLEGRAFVAGSGANQPSGFTLDAVVIANGVTNSGVANDITADGIITLAGTLKTGYKPVYLLNRTTIAACRKLKDGQGNYIWQSGLTAGLPNSLNGYPYIEIPDMPAIGVNLYPIAFGDFYRGYNIVDNMALYMIRDEFTLATTGKVKFVALKSVGGGVVQPESIKLLKCAA